MMTLRLMFREYCGLCHQMRDALEALKSDYTFEVEIIEIDNFPEWEQQYNEKVPVLLHGAHEICYWHFDEAAVRAYLAANGV